MRLTTAISVALATISTSSVTAQTERDLDSHDHGHAFLNIAIDGSTAIVELESPWNNLVGFEHAPRTEEQHAMVDAAMAMLNQPDDLFTFNGTECVMAGAVVQSSIDEGNGHDEHDDEHKDGHDDEHHDEHDDEHKDEHHDDHDDGHKDEHDDEHEDGHHDEHEEGHDHDHEGDGEGEVHSSVLASYNFNCSNIDDLQSVEVGLFEKMSGFEEVDVQLIGPGGQDAMELTASQFTVDFGKVR